MLETLRSIVQEVNSASDLTTALEVIVRRVREAMNTDVCSIYLLNQQRSHYVLMATEGLRKDSVGKATLGVSEGLVGQVGLREEPLNLENAPDDPRYHYLPETGEEAYRSFLGVPIIHQREVLGVMVVQQGAQRRFDEGEEAFLVTMSAQLAAVIAHAEATGSVFGVGNYKETDVRFGGVAGASGVAIGTAHVVYPAADLEAVPDKTVDDPEKEAERFNEALDRVREDIAQLRDKLAYLLPPEEQALFDVYLRMLDDSALGGEVLLLIREGNWAPGALRQIVQEHVHHFELMEDPYLRERATDIRDLGRRILAHLQEGVTSNTDAPSNTVLVGEELTPTMLGEVDRDKIVGLVSVQGSGNSHIAILARAMGIPTVMGAVDLPFTQLDGQEIIVDGYNGLVLTNPTQQMSRQYEEIIQEERQLVEGLEALRDLPSTTSDNYRVQLWVNTGLMTDVHRSLERGAEGVGLYRTEIPFMINDRFPSEEEQRQIYRQQLEAFAPSEVTMRTLDIGGDKALSYFPIEEDNPFLGWRGIRVTLDHPEIFLVQVRAMLRASEGLNNLRIMLPMICSVLEVEDAMHLIHRALHEVREEGASVDMPPIGVMVEVPAAVYQARQLARRVDFLSVGSNDLTQYLLAVDRNNSRVAGLYHSFHPAVLMALKKVADDAHMEGKQVSICGEMAGDPAAALLLMAMGYDILSMNASNLPKVKWVIRNFTLVRAKELLDRVMHMDNPYMIRSYLDYTLSESGFGRLVKPGRAVAEAG